MNKFNEVGGTGRERLEVRVGITDYSLLFLRYLWNTRIELELREICCNSL